MKKWFVSAKKADFNKIASDYSIDPVVARVIRNRDIITDEDIGEYLRADVLKLHDFHLMKGINEGTSIIKDKITNNKKIRIIGDYDIDGICSTYILYRGLLRCKAKVDYEIPDRILDGYGINEHLISQAKESGIDTIITCDNGISAAAQIDYAKKLDMTVVITDHHDVPFIEDADKKRQEIVPKADVVVNPKQHDCLYPFKELCGAVVALKFVEGLYEKFDIKHTQVYEFLDAAAIATIGDVVDLKGENRTITKLGLEAFRHTKNYGFKALTQVTGIDPLNINSYHIGFVIGPCINASGRLYTAKQSLKLLLSTSYDEAYNIAAELKDLNDKRKEMTSDGVASADEIIKKQNLANDKVIVVYVKGCHESLIGIIAGRIREKYYRPVFVLTDGEDAVKGSGRSIEGYHMFEEMIKCRELFEKFGGHSMAAGLSIKKEKIELLRKMLNDNSTLKEEDFIEKLVIDVPMPLSYIRQDLIEQLSYLEPFGKGNPKPVFARNNIKIIKARIIGKNKNAIKMQVQEENSVAMDALYFKDVIEFQKYVYNKFGNNEGDNLFKRTSDKIYMSLAYYPTINEYNGCKSLQIIVQDYC